MTVGKATFLLGTAGRGVGLGWLSSGILGRASEGRTVGGGFFLKDGFVC